MPNKPPTENVSLTSRYRLRPFYHMDQRRKMWDLEARFLGLFWYSLEQFNSIEDAEIEIDRLLDIDKHRNEGMKYYGG